LTSNQTKAQHLKPQIISEISNDGKKQKITVTTHVLPHITNLTGLEKDLIGGIDSLNREQGFYIYRNDRLIIWGNWFRYNGRNELYKYGRIEVSIPNNLDEIWNVDIKKASVSIPDRIKRKLYDAVNEATKGSYDLGKKRVRGNLHREDIVETWLVTETEKSFHYKINRETQLIKQIYFMSDEKQRILLENLLRDIEATLPIHGIHHFVANDTYVKKPPQNSECLERLINNLLSIDDLSNSSALNLIKMFVKIDAYQELEGKENDILEEFICRKQMKS
jgi:hypothetical protein